MPPHHGPLGHAQPNGHGPPPGQAPKSASEYLRNLNESLWVQMGTRKNPLLLSFSTNAARLVV